MKRKFKSIGVVDFSKADITDTLHISIDIEDVSKELKQRMDESISKKVRENKRKGEKWSNQVKDILPCIYAIFPKDGKLSCGIIVCFTDMETKSLQDSVYLEINQEDEVRIKSYIAEMLLEKILHEEGSLR